MKELLLIKVWSDLQNSRGRIEEYLIYLTHHLTVMLTHTVGHVMSDMTGLYGTLNIPYKFMYVPCSQRILKCLFGI
jgi:hypothetical protein